MDIEDQMEISALLGIPMVDLLDKTEDFLAKIHALVRQETDGPRLALILMAAAYLYHVRLAIKEGTDIFDEAAKALLVATELLSQAMEQESTL